MVLARPIGGADRHPSINGDRRAGVFALPAREGLRWCRSPAAGTERDVARPPRRWRAVDRRAHRWSTSARKRRPHDRERRQRDDWWRGCVIYQIYPRSFQDTHRRRLRRSRGHHRAAAACRLARRRRDLAVALLQVADGRHGLRRVRLSRRRSDVRHDRGFRPAGRRGAPARPEGDHRPGAVAHLRPARMVQGKPRQPRQRQGRLVRLGRRQAGRHRADQLAVGVRRPGLGMGRHPQAILHAQFPGLAAGPQLPQRPRSRTRCSRPCASGWSAASTASGSTP